MTAGPSPFDALAAARDELTFALAALPEDRELAPDRCAAAGEQLHARLIADVREAAA
ncbi:MAG: hypothetical protein O3B31_02135 [Chloroflexi bacterium]|nr:hypothetical protein [Chloroflexota bacterium]MDA1002141.1 hypothetical protein [Chloroflexota bacterium]